MIVVVKGKAAEGGKRGVREESEQCVLCTAVHKKVFRHGMRDYAGFRAYHWAEPQVQKKTVRLDFKGFCPGGPMF